jgi:hypothetical protein
MTIFVDQKSKLFFLMGKLERLKRVKPKPKKLRRKRKIKKAAEVEVDENGVPVVRAEEGEDGEPKGDADPEESKGDADPEESKGDADPEEPKVGGDAVDEEEGKFFWGWSKTIY